MCRTSCPTTLEYQLKLGLRVHEIPKDLNQLNNGTKGWMTVLLTSGFISCIANLIEIKSYMGYPNMGVWIFSWDEAIQFVQSPWVQLMMSIYVLALRWRILFSFSHLNSNTPLRSNAVNHTANTTLLPNPSAPVKWARLLTASLRYELESRITFFFFC